MLDARVPKVKRQLTIDGVVGALMCLPIIISFAPGDLLPLSDSVAPEISQTVGLLILWTTSMTWFLRLRGKANFGICAPFLLLIAGQVVMVFFLSAAMGFGILSVALACAVPYLYSRYHWDRLKRLAGATSQSAI